ncbi:MAG: isochorismatase family protein [Acidothermaceae bacterium]
MTERIWDRFLTDQDKAHLAASRPKAKYGFGRRAAVLSVDNYRGVIGDAPQPLLEAIKTWPNSTGLAGWAALERTTTLLAAARTAGAEVIHATGLAQEESGVPGWRLAGANRGASSDADERYARRYEIVPQVAPLPGEVVLKKNAPSAFFGTALAPYLIGQRIDTLILCGEAVSGCVRATVVDGCSFRFRMIVVEDCVYDRHEASWAINLFDIDQKYGDVVSLETTLDWLKGNGAEHGGSTSS